MAEKTDATLPSEGVSPLVQPTVPTEPLTAKELAQITPFVPQQVEVKLPERSESEIDPRESIEDAAAKRVAAARAKEAKESQVPGTENPELPQAPTPQPNPAAPQAPLQAEPAAQEAPKTLRVKVDGVERDLPIEEVVRGYQVPAAGQARLAQATQTREEANRLLAEANRLFEQARQAQPQAPQPEAPRAPDLDAVVEAMANAFDYGTVDDRKAAIEALVEAVKTQQPAAPDSQAIQRQIVETIAVTTEQARTRDALGRLYAENQDIVGDRYLGAAVAAATHDAMVEDLVRLGADPQKAAHLPADQVGQYHAIARRAGQARPFDEITRQSVDAVKQRFNLAPATQAPQPGVSPLATRLDAKRQTASPPAPALVRPSPAPPRRKTTSEIIAEDRAARHAR